MASRQMSDNDSSWRWSFSINDRELPVLGSCVKIDECRELKEGNIREDEGQRTGSR